MSLRDEDPTTILTRRTALAALLGTGATLAIGCSSASSATRESDAGGAAAKRDADGTDAAHGTEGGSADAGGDGGACDTTAEGEIGPYFADDSASGFNRSVLTSNLDGSSTQTGIPLTLNVNVVDTKKACAPYAGAQVDIWHCNASGVYSDISAEDTSSDQWLRGYQITDATGRVTFQTIIPGWYSGRTTHIHLRVRSSYSDASSTSDGTNTTQCFFEQTFVDTLATSVALYDAEGKNPTTNASDRVYSEEEHGVNQLALSGNNSDGYTAFVTIFLPITATYSTSTTGAGDGGAGGMGTPGDGGFGGGPPADGGLGGNGPPGGGGVPDARIG